MHCLFYYVDLSKLLLKYVGIQVKDPYSRIAYLHYAKLQVRFLSVRVVTFQLLYMGRDYPKGYDYFRSRLKTAFLKNKDEKDPEVIRSMIGRGEFVIKELEALYMLKKYRTLKQRYSEEEPLVAKKSETTVESRQQTERPTTWHESPISAGGFLVLLLLILFSFLQLQRFQGIEFDIYLRLFFLFFQCTQMMHACF